MAGVEQWKSPYPTQPAQHSATLPESGSRNSAACREDEFGECNWLRCPAGDLLCPLRAGDAG